MTSQIDFIAIVDEGQGFMEYSIRIPMHDLIKLDFTEAERQLLNIKERPISQILLGLQMLVSKLEDKPINTQEAMDEFYRNYKTMDINDLNNMFVDHLIVNLEKRSIGGILKFLAKYCGWHRMVDFINKEKNDG